MPVELEQFIDRMDARGHHRTPEQRRAQLENCALLKEERGNVLKRADGVNANMEDGLNGDLDPSRLITRELPVHRTMINMAVAGYQITEIAKLTGYCNNTVSNVLKQPWARKYMVQEAKKTVQQEIKTLLEQEALPSLRTLITVRDSDTARPSDRANAANALLDRFLGKPQQSVLIEEKNPAEMTDEELRRAVERDLQSTKN